VFGNYVRCEAGIYLSKAAFVIKGVNELLTYACEICVFERKGFGAKHIMRELGDCVRHTFWKTAYSFVEGNYSFIKFFNGGERVRDCIKAIGDASSYDSVNHLYFLFHGGGAR